MLSGIKLICVLGIVSLSGVQFADAQQTQATSAKPASRSTGKPSSIQIQQNILVQQNALLQGQLREVQRCIQDASLPQTLRDPEGNMNRTPQTDLVNCARKLEQLKRQSASLSRQASQLAQDAQFQGLELQGLLETKKTRTRIKGKSAQ